MMEGQWGGGGRGRGVRTGVEKERRFVDHIFFTFPNACQHLSCYQITSHHHKKHHNLHRPHIASKTHLLSQAMVWAGKLSQLKWRDLLKASRWNSLSLSPDLTAKQMSDGSEDPLTLTTRIIGNSLRRISTTSSIEVTYELLVSYELLRYHGIRSTTQMGTHTRPIISEPRTQTLLQAQPPRADGNISISNRYRTLPEIAQTLRDAHMALIILRVFLSLEKTL